MSRRVVVKVHVAPLRGGGAKAAVLHLRYIERDGVEKDGRAGELYGANGPANAEAFEAPRAGEKHQFRVIVSPEDAGELDLADYVRRFMTRVERDLGRKLEWAAVNHYDTDHPHAHIVIRGVDRDGRELRFDRAYVARGLRERAQELATEELGPRPRYDVARQKRREITDERFTTLDRELEKRAVGERVEVRKGALPGRAGESESLLIGRLEHLQALRLAEKLSPTSWALAEGWKESLRELGTRGDIIKEMHRALKADPGRYQILKPGQPLTEDPTSASPVVHGRVVKKGLSDEQRGHFYAVVETPSGGGCYVPLDPRAADEIREGDLVSLSTKSQSWRRPEDRAIEQIAGGHAGVYDPQVLAKAAEVHGKGPGKLISVDLQYLILYRAGRSRGNMSIPEIVKAHEKRLIELEKLGLAARMADGKWKVQAGLASALEAKDRDEPRQRLVIQREPIGLAEQVGRRGPVWLDRVSAESLAPYGLGAELRRAIGEREEALRRLGIDPVGPQREAALREIERRDLGGRIAKETGARLLEATPRAFQGKVRMHGSFAEIRQGDRFVLVPVGRELRAFDGRTVTLSHDARGRMQVRAADRDRGRS